MFFGRKKELDNLKEIFESGNSSVTILYGKEGIGKTTLVKNFVRGKKYVYKNILPMEQKILESSLKEDVFGKITQETQIVVIEEIQNALHCIDYIFDNLKEYVKEEQQIMFILTCSSVHWIENCMVKTLESKVKVVNDIIKIKELQFVDIAKHFVNYSIEDCLKLYTITGGVPLYVARFDENKTIKQNVCSLFLDDNASHKNIGMDIVSMELRETSVYNSILWCLANEKNKLNDIYEYLKLGRDKISVYLKNLIDRGIVEKVFSIETGNKSESIKGLYRISTPIVEFWYKSIYGRISELEMIEGHLFYEKYIVSDLKELAKETIVKVANEYVDFLEELELLPINVDSKGRFYGKNGDVHIIVKDEEGNCIVGHCLYSQRQFSYDDFEVLLKNLETAKVKEEIKAFYLFTSSSFDVKLRHTAEKNGEYLALININEM